MQTYFLLENNFSTGDVHARAITLFGWVYEKSSPAN